MYSADDIQTPGQRRSSVASTLSRMESMAFLALNPFGCPALPYLQRLSDCMELMHSNYQWQSDSRSAQGSAKGRDCGCTICLHGMIPDSAARLFHTGG